MTDLPDSAARRRALTDLDATLLVEAAAGTGKTSLIAGRLTMLLVHGTPPSAIAAITFTELAASSLTARVHRYVAELQGGNVPETLRLALPTGLSAIQHAALTAAAATLDELTASTIHAFCQRIICSYAVEADIDPGARVLDATQARAAFDDVFDRWLRQRLGTEADASSPIGTLSRSDPHRLVATLRELARFRLDHRRAAPLPADLSGRPDLDFVEAVRDFQRWVASHPPERTTVDLVDQLDELASFYDGALDHMPDFERLWILAHPPSLRCMRRESTDLSTPRTKGAWERAVGKVDGARLHDEATACFERVHASYRTLRGRLATTLVAALSRELDEVLADYAEFKGRAAVLDFDDLLERAGDLIRGHDAVRRAIGARYRHLFVDEFQDTDPLQTEIVFRLCSGEPVVDWHAARIRPGSLFIVGDPKQAIYRFRGADVASYEAARRAIEREWPANVIQITANFRSRPAILQYVNHRFAAVLEARGQPGYVALTPTVVDPPLAKGAPTAPCVATIAVDLAQGAAALRDSEASAVAELCDRLIGTLHVRTDDGATTVLTPGGIALLAPTGTDLWRYERALEHYGLPFASQAGKSLFRRQEVQDIVALARVLVDARDHVAFGALMRGPLVGLTEEELLDVTAGLPVDASHPRPRFSVTTPLEHVVHPGARRALSILQDLRRRARTVTPSLVLEEAAERFLVRPLLAARERDNSARAAANVEVIIERSRAYDVKGLSAFVRDIGRDWKTSAPYTEGRADADGDAIEIITIHSAKGLEWPVVIPINTGTQLRRREKLVHRTSDNSLHWLMGDVVPPGLAGALAADDESQARERERLWYVACTRARDLLAIPRLREASDASWARIVPLALHELPVIGPEHFAPRARSHDEVVPQEQTKAVFDHERDLIAAASIPVTWQRPSDHDSDRAILTDAVPADTDSSDVVAVHIPVGAGRIRGLVLHKLMEEVLTGENGDTIAALRRRARVLIKQLASLAEDGESMPLPDEVANTAARSWELPEVAKLRPHLQAEVSVYGMPAAGATPIAIAARMDAIAVQEGRVTAVLDWKSDVAPSAADIALHSAQLRDYLELTSVARGALVYMTSGDVRWVDRGA